MLTLVFSMDALDAFPIACRRQWRTPNTRVRTMHVEHQMENMLPPKAEMQYWGHCGIGNVPSEDCQTSEHSSAPHAPKDVLTRLTSRREEALSRKRALLSKFTRALLLDERLSMRIFWRVRR